MIGLEDRRNRDIEQAHKAEARLQLACVVAGIVRTLQRWARTEVVALNPERETAVPAGRLPEVNRTRQVT